MQKVKTKHFGELEIAEERVIVFRDGLFGFENRTRFFLMEAENNESFNWLQSLDEPDLCFLVIEPVSFMFEYSLALADDVVDDLDIKVPEDVVIFALVTVPPDPAKISANLCGPLVINWKNKQARQIVSVDSAHKLKHFIIEEMKKNSTKLTQITSEETNAVEAAKEDCHAGADKKV